MDETPNASKTDKTKVSTKSSKAKTPRKKTTAAKASPKTANSKKAATKESSSKNSTVISVEQRHSMIEKTAYLIAEKRGFVDGDPRDDWLTAESQIDASITKGFLQPDSVPH